MSNSDLNTQSILKVMEEKQVRIEEYWRRFEEITGEQEIIFLEKAKELGPIIDFLKSKGYFFINPKISGQRSAVGPLIGYDSSKGINYIYEVIDGSSCIISRNVADGSLYQWEHIRTFFEENDFDVAMEGLLAILKAVDESEKVLSSEIEKREALIEKYS